MSFTEVLEIIPTLNAEELSVLLGEVRRARYDVWAEQLLIESEEAHRAILAGELKGGTAEEVIAQLNELLDEPE